MIGAIRGIAGRKIVRIAISFDLLMDMMKLGYRIDGGIECIAGLPEDAIYCGSAFDPASMEAYLFFAHESFDEIPMGSSLPIRHVAHKRSYND